MLTIKKSMLICALAAAALVGGVGSQVIVRSISTDVKPECVPAKGIDFLPSGTVEGTGKNKGY